MRDFLDTVSQNFGRFFERHHRSILLSEFISSAIILALEIAEEADLIPHFAIYPKYIILILLILIIFLDLYMYNRLKDPTATISPLPIGHFVAQADFLQKILIPVDRSEIQLVSETAQLFRAATLHSRLIQSARRPFRSPMYASECPSANYASLQNRLERWA
jgi:hypothetical protein